MRSPSASPRRSSSWPVPVSVTVYNLMAPDYKENQEKDDDEEEFTRRGIMFRPEHGSQLLVPARLDVVAADSDNQESNRVLYSSHLSCDTIHPCWDLLDERIEVLTAVMALQDSGIPYHENDDMEKNEDMRAYESMKAQILLAPQDTDTDETSEDNLEVFADFPLHPKRLRKLPEEDVRASGAGPPLRALPPNAIIIRYSDGSTRVPAVLYDFLLRQQIVSEDNILEDATLLQNASMSSNESADRRQPRFDDNVFDALDAAVRTPQRMSPSALLMMEHRIQDQEQPTPSHRDVPDELKQPKLNHNISQQRQEAQLQDKDTINAPPELERATSLLDSDDEHLLLPSETDATMDDLKKQAVELEEMLQKEQNALENDLESLQQAKDETNTVMQEFKHIERETNAIMEEAENELKRQAQIEFQLEAQRIKLLQELRTIYPIDCVADKSRRYCIRGLELPVDLHSASNTVGEDEISAALGYTCHAVSIMSKYLDVPLRYRLVCNSSSSAIQEDGHTMFPLFQARMVEKSQLDRGVELLERNVDCLLLARGLMVPPTATIHILAKVKRLYDAIIDGV